MTPLDGGVRAQVPGLISFLEEGLAVARILASCVNVQGEPR